MPLAAAALEVIQHLSAAIGGRGSCTPQERAAAEYTAVRMQNLGLRDVRLEPLQTTPHTYTPFLAAFGAGILGFALTALFPHPAAALSGAALTLAGGLGMLAELDLRPNWLRALLPTASSQNAVGMLPAAAQPPARRAVICAHVDTHRTPIFYSSLAWYHWFSRLVSAAAASLFLNALLCLLSGLPGAAWLLWPAGALAALQLAAAGLCAQALFTPFSPGANDNASGVGVALALAEHLSRQPLEHTELWWAFTGCEEVGARGFQAFLDAHAHSFGPETLYLILDEVGQGRVEYLQRDGLVKKYPTHPRALALAQAAAAALPELGAAPQVGLAYTDALAATQRGAVALSLNTYQPPMQDDDLHWHQMSDQIQHIDPAALERCAQFALRVLHIWDQAPPLPPHKGDPP